MPDIISFYTFNLSKLAKTEDRNVLTLVFLLFTNIYCSSGSKYRGDREGSDGGGGGGFSRRIVEVGIKVLVVMVEANAVTVAIIIQL